MYMLVGSRALAKHYPHGVKSSIDWDYIATPSSVNDVLKKHGKYTSRFNTPKKIIVFYGPRAKPDKIVEIELAPYGSTGYRLLRIEGATEYTDKTVASPEALFLLKMSHRYLKNSPHFEKTMNDINFLRNKLSIWSVESFYTPSPASSEYDYYFWYKDRERETLDYGHPKLNQSKKDFFQNDGLTYVYDHDSIHQSVAGPYYQPAYLLFKEPGEEVKCSKELFYDLSEHNRLRAVYEESVVLALERSQIPYKGTADPHKSFVTALQKVCTSITSGWFREFAWENYYTVKNMYNKNYVKNFWEDVEKGKVKLHGQ